MNESFTIEASWLPADHGSVEERATAAELRIALGDEVVTTVEDFWASSVRDRIRVSAWPLAVWFASSWWRLRWEAASEIATENTAFLQSHEMAGVGGGYLWPRLSFRTDGELIEIVSQPSKRRMGEPVRYLERFRLSIRAEDFERSVAAFIETVIARLENSGVGNSLLHDLWRELGEERSDPAVEAYRTLEARLGFDPDEAGNDLIEMFDKLKLRVGREAALEVASMGFPTNPKALLGKLESATQAGGIDGSFEAFDKASFVTRRKARSPEAPWTRGRQLARDVRAKLGLNGHAIDNDQLSGLIGVTRSQFQESTPVQIPIGLGVRGRDESQAQFFFRRKNLASRRFEAARLIADYLIATDNDRWLPVTDSDTARQKVQRAFAAEFLAPIESLKARLGQRISDEDVAEVADDYGVSGLLVWSSLVNNGVISREQAPIGL